MDISLVQGSTAIVLNGAGAAAPLTAGRMESGGPGRVTLDCALSGTPAQLAEFQGGLEKALALGELYAGLPGEDWAYLTVTLPDGTQWRTPVLSGLCEAIPGPGARAAGAQGLRLRLSVEPWWESATLTDCPLSNRYGVNVTGGINADNHQDSVHNNYVAIANTAVQGDIPAPAVISLAAVPNGLEYLLGQAVTNNVGSFVGVVEGESYAASAFSSTVVSPDTACSNSGYAAFSWSGTGTASARWTLTSSSFTGRIYRPVMRLRDLPAAGEKIYSWLRVGVYGSAFDTAYESEGVVLPSDRKLVVFPPLALPPWPRPPAGFAWDPCHFEWVVQAEGGGAHVLNVDCIQFLPTEGWLRFYPVLPNTTYSMIRYDCGSGQLSRTTSGMVTHAPEGPGILLYPGALQRIFVLAQNASGMDINTLHTLQVQYRARKRVL